MQIEFVSYSGKFPNLCSGELVLKINGRKRTFGVDYGAMLSWEETRKRAEKNYNRFWRSGGGITSDYNTYSGAWTLTDVNDLPKYLQPYADELIEIFNTNVPWGCCGGCI